MHLLHRVWIEIETLDAWYTVIKEANTLYGTHNWKGQSRVRRKLEHNWYKKSVRVWFDVPDPTFATWISVKHGINSQLEVAK